MPFTPTHTLATVPIAWFWSGAGVFPALVIGSMVPDWPLYVPYGPRYQLTHSFPGILLACLPIGFVISIFFQLALKRALYELLPRIFQARLVAYVAADPLFGIRPLLMIAAAVSVGATTHIAWDAFTHYGQWGAELVPLLYERITLTGNFSLPVYSLLQHGSTLLGLPIFLLMLAIWFRKSREYALPQPLLTSPLRVFWAAALILIPLGLMTFILIDLTVATSARDVFRILFFGVTRAGLASLVSLLCYGVFFAAVMRFRVRGQ